ncbi:HAD family hydrolase [Allosphingosinicella vermicomposti]|uniref:HAD family hydrolase n=1 Tax=Allosphingosinicella vermicomposti TaxID=614671 RepID=UPI000D0F25C5|nr:HAD-IB family phosphatase [Allosphingosinicella vermicomposti]
MKSALAIYDMDRTITRNATYTPFLIHAARQLAPWRLVLMPFVILSMLAYVAKLIDRGRLKEINYTLLIGRSIAPERLEPVIQSFADKQVATNILPGARASIAADRAAGRRVVMATASYRLYAAAIAERLGITDVIATETGLDAAGRIVAKIEGRNCYGDEKLAMIQAWLEREGLTREAVHIRFYSDHVSDAPVHHWSDEPVAANAHDRLVRLAEVEGWEVLDWRKRQEATQAVRPE